MKFYHFSDQNIKDTHLRPKYFGQNYYSKLSLTLSKIPRTYFYDTPRAQECFTKGHRYRYTVNISKKLLAPAQTYAIPDAKAKGHLGVRSNKTSPWQGCLIFQRIKIIEKTDLWKAKTNA